MDQADARGPIKRSHSSNKQHLAAAALPPDFHKLPPEVITAIMSTLHLDGRLDETSTIKVQNEADATLSFLASQPSVHEYFIGRSAAGKLIYLLRVGPWRTCKTNDRHRLTSLKGDDKLCRPHGEEQLTAEESSLQGRSVLPSRVGEAQRKVSVFWCVCGGGFEGCFTTSAVVQLKPTQPRADGRSCRD